jgi:hypothetical protein
MCPVCIATAALIAGKVTSAGGFSAIAIKKLVAKKAADNDSTSSPSKLSEKDNAAAEIVPNSNQKEK